MAELSGRGRSLFGDVLGFDPLRMLPNVNGGFGFDIQRSEGGYRIELPVPGFRPDQIDVTVEDRVLSIVGKGDRRQFTRTLVLPDEIDADAIAATVEHGMLALDLRLHAKAQPRKIEVRVGDGQQRNVTGSTQPASVGGGQQPSQN